MKSSEKKQLKCPSAMPSNASDLFGIVNDEGVVKYLQTPLKMDRELINEKSINSPLDSKFRFTSKCIETGCNHWSNDSKVCSLIKSIVSKFQPSYESLQHCAIRNDCRWYDQEGRNACEGCSFVRRTY